MTVMRINGWNPRATTPQLHQALITRWADEARWEPVVGPAALFNQHIAACIRRHVKTHLKNTGCLPAGQHAVTVHPEGSGDPCRTVTFPDQDEADYRIAALTRIRPYRRAELAPGRACVADVVQFLHAGFLGPDALINALVAPQAHHLQAWLQSPAAQPVLARFLLKTGLYFDLDLTRNPVARWIKEEGSAFGAHAGLQPIRIRTRMIIHRLQNLDKHMAPWERQPPMPLHHRRFRQYLLTAPTGHSAMLVMLDFSDGPGILHLCKRPEELSTRATARQFLLL